MTYKKFILSIVCLGIIFIFAKIYEQNRALKFCYALQRVERECEQLTKACNQKNIELAKLKDPAVLKKRALAMGFVPLDKKQFVFTSTFTTV